MHDVSGRLTKGLVEQGAGIGLLRYVKELDLASYVVRVVVRFRVGYEDLCTRRPVLEHRNERVFKEFRAARASNDNREARHVNLP